MTRKEKILRMIQKMPDDVTYERVIYNLDTMQALEVADEQIARGGSSPMKIWSLS